MTEHPPISPEAEMLLDLITQRYGTRLAPPELQDIRHSVAGLTRIIADLRAVKLDNSAEPCCIFVPYAQRGTPQFREP